MIVIKKTLLLVFSMAMILIITTYYISCSSTKKIYKTQTLQEDSTDFFDSAHHWYDIKDTDKIIEPLKQQKRYTSDEYEKIADNIILFQKTNGGWAKNYDMRAILTEDQKEKILDSKDLLNTCFDNGATHSQLNYLGKVIAITNKEKYKAAFINGIKFIISAQYSNGGWPQFYPDTSGYRKFITYNDGAMIGVMKLLRKVFNKQNGYNLPDSNLYIKVVNSYNLGIDCILNTQIKESDSLLVWCQQHNNITLLPEKARSFEPAAICNGESSEIVKFLMSIQNPDNKIIFSIKSAVKWFLKSRLYGIRIETVKAPKVEFIYQTSDTDREVIHDPSAKPVWTRFYQLETHIPIFCNRDGKIVYSYDEVERERRVGYSWYVYGPQEVIDEYTNWLKRINEN